jgi:predicted nuclease of restriction endonuclease-like (RecB) superfamily
MIATKGNKLQKFQITSQHLDEMEQLAIRCPMSLEHLTYRELQQTLTLYSLIALFQNYGLELPFEVENLNSKETL